MEYPNSEVIQKNILKQLKLKFISKYCGCTPLPLERLPNGTYERFLQLFNFNSFV